MRSGLVLVLLAAACGPPDTGPAAIAENMWRRLQQEPGTQAYQGFIEANKKAAFAHRNTEDREGVEGQVRYAEASADEALRTRDAILADEVFDMVARLRTEGRLDDYERIVPGVTARLDAAESKVRPLLLTKK